MQLIEYKGLRISKHSVKSGDKEYNQNTLPFDAKIEDLSVKVCLCLYCATKVGIESEFEQCREHIRCGCCGLFNGDYYTLTGASTNYKLLRLGDELINDLFPHLDDDVLIAELCELLKLTVDGTKIKDCNKDEIHDICFHSKIRSNLPLLQLVDICGYFSSELAEEVKYQLEKLGYRNNNIDVGNPTSFVSDWLSRKGYF